MPIFESKNAVLEVASYLVIVRCVPESVPEVIRIIAPKYAFAVADVASLEVVFVVETFERTILSAFAVKIVPVMFEN